MAKISIDIESKKSGAFNCIKIISTQTAINKDEYDFKKRRNEIDIEMEARGFYPRGIRPKQ